MREIAKDPRFEVTVAAPQFFHGSLRDTLLESEPEGSNLKLIGLDAYMTKYMHLFFYNPIQLQKLVQKGFDVAHLWEEPYILSGFQLAQVMHRQKIPYSFFTGQSLAKDYPLPFSFFDRWVEQHSQLWIGCGQLINEAMVKKGWDEGAGQVIPLSVDTNLFKPFGNLEKSVKKKQYHLQGTVIGMLGRLTEEKGCEILMKTIARLDTNVPWSLFIMGSGPYGNTIKAWAKEKGISDRIHIQLFNHQEVSKVLPLCDILLCPSQTRKFWKEQFGRMVVEAFASGVMVIGSDSGEIPYVIGNAGMIVGEADIEGWVGALKRAMTDIKLRNDYIKKGLERAPLFSSEAVAERYKECFIKIANKQNNFNKSHPIQPQV